jgi:radical SAM superfamily enzyme YgiQ (UPF0313 family)
MHVLLVRPHYATHARPTGYPIGLGYLAAYLEKQGHQATILDLAGESDWRGSVRRQIDRDRYDLAGVTCMSVQYAGARQAAAYIRELCPELKIVFGGAHPTNVPKETLADDFVDFVAIGEGEAILHELLIAVHRNQEYAAIEGLAFKTQEGIQVNGPRRCVPQLDDLPFPAYHLLDLNSYTAQEIPGFAPRKRPAIQIFTSRGCPFLCIFCHDIFGKKFRARSPENILKEMQLLYNQYGVREFLVYDDNFTMDIEHAKRICRLIVDSGMDISMQFPNGIRADRMDEELMDLMARAGTHSIAVGIESGNKRVQKLIKKGLILERVPQTIALARKYGITTCGFFMIGFPFETIAEINETIRFARQSELDHALFAIATPYAGTELFQLITNLGYDSHMDPENLDIMAPHIQTEHFTLRRIKWLHMKAHLLFYLQPRRLGRLIASLADIDMLTKYLRGLNKYLLQNFRYILRNPKGDGPASHSPVNQHSSKKSSGIMGNIVRVIGK